MSYHLSQTISEIVEQRATTPFENVLSQIVGINKIYAVSKQIIAKALTERFSVSYSGIYENDAGQKLFIKTGETIDSLEQLA